MLLCSTCFQHLFSSFPLYYFFHILRPSFFSHNCAQICFWHFSTHTYSVSSKPHLFSFQPLLVFTTSSFLKLFFWVFFSTFSLFQNLSLCIVVAYETSVVAFGESCLSHCFRHIPHFLQFVYMTRDHALSRSPIVYGVRCWCGKIFSVFLCGLLHGVHCYIIVISVCDNSSSSVSPLVA